MFFNHLSTKLLRANWGNSHIFCQCKEPKLNYLTVCDVNTLVSMKTLNDNI